MSKSSKSKGGISRRSMLKGAAGAVGLAAGSGAITGFPYVHSADPKVLRYLGNWPDWALQAVIAKHTQGRFLGLLGEPTVNVLQLNLDLDGVQTKA